MPTTRPQAHAGHRCRSSASQSSAWAAAQPSPQPGYRLRRQRRGRRRRRLPDAALRRPCALHVRAPASRRKHYTTSWGLPRLAAARLRTPPHPGNLADCSRKLNIMHNIGLLSEQASQEMPPGVKHTRRRGKCTGESPSGPSRHWGVRDVPHCAHVLVRPILKAGSAIAKGHGCELARPCCPAQSLMQHSWVSGILSSILMPQASLPQAQVRCRSQAAVLKTVCR